MPLCTAPSLRNLPPPRPQGWRPKFGQEELVDLPPAKTSSSDAMSIGLPRRSTAQVRSEARNHHPCPLCPSACPRRPLWPSMTALGAAHVLPLPCQAGPAHPTSTLSESPLISLPVCKNSSHSPSPFPCLPRRRSADSGARGARLEDRRARHPVGPFPRLWAHWARSLRRGRACTLFGCDACMWCRAVRVPCRPSVYAHATPAGPSEPLWVHAVVAHL